MAKLPAPIRFIKAGATATAITTEDYYQYLYDGWTPGAPAPAKGRDKITARLSDLDDLMDSIGDLIDAIEVPTYDDTNLQASLATVDARVSTYVKTKVLVIGSSNAYGQGASNPATTSWVALKAAELSATHTFVNVAVSGTDANYWVTPGTSGRSPLEDLISTHRPHIVLAALTAQNTPGGPSEGFLNTVEQARAIAHARGVRFVGITPYISEVYQAITKDKNRFLAETLKARRYPLIDFEPVWGRAATIPDSIDTGDGLHLNDTGHAELARHVVNDYLNPSTRLDPINLPSSGGLVVPSGITASPGPLTVTALPTGSWTIGMTIKWPTTDRAGIGLFAPEGSNSATRVRVPTAGNLDVAGGVTHAAITGIVTGSEHHLALSYNAITKESRFYFDGVLASSATYTGSPTFTNLIVGSVAQGIASGVVATGYRYRGLTIHATTLSDNDVARLASGEVPTASMHLVSGLTDSAGRPAGAWMPRAFGRGVSVVSNYALP